MDLPKLRRRRALITLERQLWEAGAQIVAGVDEAGRGPLAGPVVAAAVVFPAGCKGVRGVNDSKMLSEVARNELDRRIRRRAIAFGIGAASAREIDRINILRASHLAMRRALARLRLPVQHVIVDGLPVPDLGAEQTAVVDGDAKIHCVACASVLAKVMRDRLMRRLAVRYPQYHWDTNVGYGTPEHRAALLVHGPSPHHRLSFAPLQFTLEL
ncbi:MAG TPA: ribonuclease HII [Longimicrobiales bacterium]|nr:ribonuclease HII [Longimicrobiales bacterium]